MAALYDGDDNRVFTASRKEGKHTYQLFQKKPEDKKGRKSPYTAPGGEEPSLFWYGFSQNVLQALSTLPQTVGSLWHDLFEDVSTAYHQKLSKDRANEDGLVVNPPDVGDLPGEGEVTYASQVKDVLIPYTTREDEFHYYEERNYVNDVNREHTQVLQTYDRELKARETYTYGNGRASYLDNQTGDSYHYLTSQSGSVTGLTKDGKAVSSTSYALYGASKQTTDQTGQPYAYNGEARDGTGLDYLRARYYDSQAETFLTADSYQGVLTRPLSQNNYSYVENNPVNYIDPSGHRQELNKDWGGGRGKPKLEPQTGATRPPYDPSRPGGLRDANMDLLADAMGAGRPISFKEMAERGVHIPTAHLQAHAAYYGHHYANNQSVYNETSYNWATEQLNQRIQQLETDYQNATGGLGKKKLRETADMLKNWTKELEESIRHICDPNTVKGKDDGKVNLFQMSRLTVEEKNKIDQMSLSELNSTYDNIISSYRTFTGTGYFKPTVSPKNDYIIAKYHELKAMEEAERARKIAEFQLLYVGFNQFDFIKEHGYHPSGRPATQDELNMVNSWWYEPLKKSTKFNESFASFYMSGIAYGVGQRVTGKPIYGWDTNLKGLPTEPPISSRLVFGSETKSSAKLERQMDQRGWSKELIKATVDVPHTTRESKNLGKGNSATVYYDKNGHYVIVDDVTKEIVQISNRYDANWQPDKNIQNPYFP